MKSIKYYITTHDEKGQKLYDINYFDKFNEALKYFEAIDHDFIEKYKDYFNIKEKICSVGLYEEILDETERLTVIVLFYKTF